MSAIRTSSTTPSETTCTNTGSKYDEQMGAATGMRQKQERRKENAETTVVLYMRVSTKKQADKGYSLEEQDKDLRDYCVRQCWEIGETFIDRGESARSIDRPEFQRLLTFCKSRRPDFVIVADLSRFARDMEGQAQAIAELRRWGVCVRSLREPNIDDSAVGRLAANMIGAFNQYYSDSLSERMQKASHASRQAGRWSRNAPLGYKNVKNPSPRLPNIMPDEAALFVSRAFEMMASGNHKTAEVLRIVTNEGLTTRKGKPVPMQTFVEILRNPVYIGMQRSKKYEETTPGLWPPIVDERTFRAVQMILSGKKPTSTPYARRQPQFPLRVTLLCYGCGKPLTGGNPKGRGGKKYPGYWCRTPGCRAVKSTSVVKVEAQFVELLKRLRANPDFVAKFMPVLEKAWRASGAERTAEITKMEADLQEQRELKKKLSMSVVKGIIDKPTFDELKQECIDQIEGIEEYLNVLGVQEMKSEFFWLLSRNLLLDISTAWMRGTVDQRQMFQKILFPNGLVYSQSKGILNTDKECLFSKLEEFMSDYLSLASPTGFEPVLPP
jgi:site-specific DNA recombinase